MTNSRYLYIQASIIFKNLILSALLFTVVIANAQNEAFFDSDEQPWYSITHPRAVHYKDKTYVTFQHTSMNPYIMCYDHKLRQWSDAVQVGESDIEDTDTHGNPAVWLDSKAYINVTYGGHSGWNNGVQKMARSKSPGDISTWRQVPVFEKNCTYPQVHKKENGDLLLFYRKGRHSITRQTSGPWGYQTSSDGGKTWSNFTEVFIKGDGDVYASTELGPDGILHVVVVWESPPKIGRQDIYYVYLKDNIWYNQHNEKLPRSMGLSHLNELNCKIYDTGDDKSTHIPDIFLDPDGNVYLGICSVDQNRFLLAKRVNRKPFIISEIADGCSYWHSSAIIHVVSPDEINAYVNAHGKTGRGGQVEQWQSTDGGQKWRKIKDVTSFSDAYSLQRVRNPTADALITFERASDHTLYLYGKNGYLGGAN